jgi:hypothetical protein
MSLGHYWGTIAPKWVRNRLTQKLWILTLNAWNRKDYYCSWKKRWILIKWSRSRFYTVSNPTHAFFILIMIKRFQVKR